MFMTEERESRIRLNSGKQKEIISGLANEYGSLKSLAKKIKIPYSTMKGYASEIVLLPKNIFNKILDLSNINKEEVDFETIAPNWGQSIGGKNGIKSLLKKYPKEKIIEWRKLGCENSSIINKKKIRIPFLNEELAEFIGVYLGDGTLTKNFISIIKYC